MFLLASGAIPFRLLLRVAFWLFHSKHRTKNERSSFKMIEISSIVRNQNLRIRRRRLSEETGDSTRKSRDVSNANFRFPPSFDFRCSSERKSEVGEDEDDERAFSKGGERGNGRIYILTSRFRRRREVEKSYLHPSFLRISKAPWKGGSKEGRK